MRLLPRRNKPRGLRRPARLTGWALRVPLRTMALVGLFNVTVKGREIVPRKGAALIACNHISMLDAVFLFGALRRTAIALAMVELWSWPGVKWVMSWQGHIAVDRGNREAGKVVTWLAERVLKYGGLLFWFPEGKCSRSGELLPFKPGLISLAYRLNMPVIPAGLRGTNDVLPLGTKRIRRKRPVQVAFVPAVNPWDYATEEAFADAIWQRVLYASTL